MGEKFQEKMDDYTREMMDLKTLVTRTLEKKGVLAKIRVSITALSLCCSFFFSRILMGPVLPSQFLSFACFTYFSAELKGFKLLRGK